jgi:hypothetical protein
MKYDISVASDLYDAGRDDDGYPFIAELYYVVLQYEDGRTFRHNATFLGDELEVDDEDGMVYHNDVRTEALAKAEHLAERVRQAGTVDFQYWEETDPAYGSDAYIAQGTEAKRAFVERVAN